MVYLTLSDFEVICNELASLFKKNNDPIPVFKHTYFDKLDGVIASAQRTFGKKDLYPTIYTKTACYMYFINKIHPFNNGNKRVSIVSAGVFLQYNGYEFTADEEEIYDLAKKITLSKNKQDDDIAETTAFIKAHTRRNKDAVQSRFMFAMLKLLRRE
ncbi:MAG: type II toxin-antitoxin system death-on-curing family toxin [Microgenomates group bacterium]